MSIATRLYLIVGIMALLITIELIALWFAIGTLSSVRAYVGGEGLWSKAQKDALYQLQRYNRTHDESAYYEFLDFMNVPLGDHIARVEMLKEHPDFSIIRKGFTQGRIHPDDIDGIVKLFRRFHNVSYINHAIAIWTEADSSIAKILPLAGELHTQIKSGIATKESTDAVLDQIVSINRNLTALEDNFSYTLGEGSRWLENLILKILFAVALTVEISGLLLTIMMSRKIATGIRTIVRASIAIGKGDFTVRTKRYSHDELGLLADSFNRMAADLQSDRIKRSLTETEMKQLAEELVRSNKELELFAYTASHDLQEPLRVVTNYVQLLQRKYQGKLDKDADEFIGYTVDATERMYHLIHDLLAYSRIGSKKKEFTTVDINKVIHNVNKNLGTHISENSVDIEVAPLPSIHADETQMTQLFQNIIGNAIKFKNNRPPKIEISAKEEGEFYTFSVKDNGIGIPSEYKDKIFAVFQRLNSRKDYPGTGIGLAISKKIVEGHGGNIWVESEEGKGSTFYFTIKKEGEGLLQNS